MSRFVVKKVPVYDKMETEVTMSFILSIKGLIREMQNSHEEHTLKSMEERLNGQILDAATEILKENAGMRRQFMKGMVEE